MMLCELIEALKKVPPDKVVPLGFANPHSYRGFYEQLAFEPVANITVKEMLDAAEVALGSTFEGWKGGEYTVGGYTDVWLAERGSCGEGIGPLLLSYMLGEDAAIRVAVADETEACAKVAEDSPGPSLTKSGPAHENMEIAAAIRVRSKP